MGNSVKSYLGTAGGLSLAREGKKVCQELHRRGEEWILSGESRINTFSLFFIWLIVGNTWEMYRGEKGSGNDTTKAIKYPQKPPLTEGGATVISSAFEGLTVKLWERRGIHRRSRNLMKNVLDFWKSHSRTI